MNSEITISPRLGELENLVTPSGHKAPEYFTKGGIQYIDGLLLSTDTDKLVIKKSYSLPFSDKRAMKLIENLGVQLDRLKSNLLKATLFEDTLFALAPESMVNDPINDTIGAFIRARTSPKVGNDTRLSVVQFVDETGRTKVVFGVTGKESEDSTKTNGYACIVAPAGILNKIPENSAGELVFSAK